MRTDTNEIDALERTNLTVGVNAKMAMCSKEQNASQEKNADAVMEIRITKSARNGNPMQTTNASVEAMATMEDTQVIGFNN